MSIIERRERKEYDKWREKTESSEEKEFREMTKSLVKQGLYKWRKKKTECVPVENINKLISKEEKQMIQKQMNQIGKNLKAYYNSERFKRKLY